jgi:hypothetical protein
VHLKCFSRVDIIGAQYASSHGCGHSVTIQHSCLPACTRVSSQDSTEGIVHDTQRAKPASLHDLSRLIVRGAYTVLSVAVF